MRNTADKKAILLWNVHSSGAKLYKNINMILFTCKFIVFISQVMRNTIDKIGVRNNISLNLS